MTLSPESTGVGIVATMINILLVERMWVLISINLLVLIVVGWVFIPVYGRLAIAKKTYFY